MALAHVDDVAAAVVAHTGPITSMKLQKLIYYSQAWHLVRTGQPLFEDRIEAWPQGPVVPTIFRQHRQRYTVRSWPSGDENSLVGVEMETLAWVLGKYAHLSAESLSHMTHIELPWKIARGLAAPDEKSSEEITHDRLRHFYARQVADPETAVFHAAASSAMEGVELDEDWQETLRSVANGTCSAEEAVRREINRVATGE